MAHPDAIDDITISEIANQIGEISPSLSPSIGAQPSEVAETFSVWMLAADSIIAGSNDISQLAQNTGRWHFQIRIGGQAKAAARAIPLGGDSRNWQVRQVLESLQARQIDQAIDWIDQNIEGDPVARILEIPAYRITAFWLFDQSTHDSEVVVASAPPSMGSLQTATAYSSKDFLDALRKEGFIAGIG